MSTVPILYSGALLIEKGVIRLQFSVLIVTLNTVLDREHGLPSVCQ